MPESPEVRKQRTRGLFFLGLVVGCVGFAVALQMAANSNFVAEEMGLDGFHQGVLETFREVCGITALGLLAVLAGLAEPRVAAAMLMLFGVGLGSYAVVPDYFWLVIASMVWSQGMHVWMPLPQSMPLALAEPGRAGWRLGQIRAAGAVGAGVGLGLALILIYSKVKIRPLFLLAGGTAVLGAVACFGIPRRIKTPGPRLVFRRRYGLFYLLSFLEGWRKQIFVAFAGFLLVKRHGIPLTTMLWLWLAIRSIGWVASPVVGRVIDRLGERRVLMFYFAGLMLVFVGYAAIQNPVWLCVLYVIDSAFFVFAMALTTYVNRIAPENEHTQTLSMGVAMNHVAAVTMPLAGALLWKSVGYQWVFFLGAAVAAVSALVALRIPARGDAQSAPAGAASPAAETVK